MCTELTAQRAGSRELARALLPPAAQPDGKIVLAGYCYSGSINDFCAVRYDGGPFGDQNCEPDLDGDGQFLATTDALIYTCVALGITGNAVIGGITFPPNAARKP